MSGSEFDELLSAYLDNEVTAEERALVERRLERTPSLRESLDDYAEVSEAIRSLPRPAVPAGLADRILVSIAPPLPRRDAPLTARPARRAGRWMVGTAVACMCVAGLLILTRGPHDSSDEYRLAGGQLPPVLELPAAVTMSTASTPTGPDSREPSRVDHQASSLFADKLQEAESLNDLLVNLQRRPDLGEVVRIIDDNASETRVLEYLVTDVDEMAGEVRTVFARNGIEPVMVTSPAPQSGVAEGLGAEALQNRMFVFYVEGEESQVDTALTQMDGMAKVVEISDYGTLAGEPSQSTTAPVQLRSVGQVIDDAFVAEKSVPQPSAVSSGRLEDGADGRVIEERVGQERMGTRRFMTRSANVPWASAASVASPADSYDREPPAPPLARRSHSAAGAPPIVAEEQAGRTSDKVQSQVPQAAAYLGYVVTLPEDAAKPVMDQLRSRGMQSNSGVYYRNRVGRRTQEPAQEAGARNAPARLMIIVQQPVPALAAPAAPAEATPATSPDN